jgi:hypothetical protein
MYEVSSSGAQRRYRLRLLLIVFAVVYAVLLGIMYVLVSYVYSSGDTDLERNVFLLGTPVLCGGGCFTAAALYLVLSRARYGWRRSLKIALLVLVSTYPLGVASALFTSALSLHHPAQTFAALLIWQALVTTGSYALGLVLSGASLP